MSVGLSRRLLNLDAEYSRKLRIAERPGTLRRLAALLARSGDSWFWLVGLLLIWGFAGGLWKPLARAMLIGILITAIIVFIIKLTVRRQRPAGEWGEIYRKTDPHSFPSGHAARVFMLAVVALGMGPTWLGWVLLMWAPLVTLSRVAMGVHYLSDVIVGAALGLFTGGLTLILVTLF